tara:strand:+ start:31 stop:480 length:450 start_codon:yes stop_codon:yes gene_type:complete
LNFFLYINKKLIIYIGLTLFLIFLSIIFFKQYTQINIKLSNIEKNLPNVDIAEPKFAINNESKKIFITAKVGNFLNKDEILLQENVRFKSNDFSIETDRVVFNRNKQTANSNSKSLFKTENTTISSDGFNIYDKGDKIIFYGNSFIVLK